MPQTGAIAEPPISAAEAARPVPYHSSLRSSVQWSLIGNVFYSACQWAILIVLAKLGSPESVGQFALGLALTAPIMLFANLQLSALQATDAKREFRFGHYLALRLITTLLALVVIAGLAFGVGYNPVTAAVVLAVGVAKAFESISDVYYGVMQQHRRLERVAWSMIIKGTLSVLAVTAALWLTDSILGAAIALAATWGLLMLVYDLRSIAWLRSVDADSVVEPGLPCWDWHALGRLTWLAFPIGVRVMLFTLCFNIPRYFIEEYHGEQQLGIFAALAYVTVVAQVLSNAIGQAAAPRLGAYYAAGDMIGFRMLVLKLAGVGVVLGGAGVVLALLIGRPLLTLLYRPEYAEHADVFAWIMAAAGVWCVVSMFVVAANAGRRQGSQAVAGIVITIVTIIASAVLIRSDSLDGAAMASVISAVAGLVVFGGLFLTIGPRSHKDGPPIDEAFRGVS